MARFFSSCSSSSTMAMLLLVGLLLPNFLILGVQSIGVCYGRLGDNLPSPRDVINLYKANGIKSLRIYDPNHEVLDVLRDSNIEIILDFPNSLLHDLTNPWTAVTWVYANIVKYYPSVNIKYIAVGTEVSPGYNETSQVALFLLPAMKNVQEALRRYKLENQIKVSTVVYCGVLASTYPPSNAVFRDDLMDFINPIIQFLVQNDNSPLLANIYPYFAYRGDPDHVSLPFALFTQQDPDQTGYTNLFDATLDTIYYALEKAGGGNLEVVVAESGWPSAGGFGATMENAETYYVNLNNHVKEGRGTPHKPGKDTQTYLFAMFDENLKGGDETEKHFGLFYPNQVKKYNINFN
ncbi:Glucan endo-1,3-beta-glucosidase, acidic isoform GI9 [Datura stramonium]|uniref:Glucan endo-1,3-beta-glucosidase, acidic isoform GI9 n=1 Tax=Datura stramonium TaxID=4076 RepID=A0ABS8V6B2_DATST|nr:Glucan endo-1,3-beta-glucosidase, acidic isoform GI9 [Datura stramonium]